MPRLQLEMDIPTEAVRDPLRPYLTAQQFVEYGRANGLPISVESLDRFAQADLLRPVATVVRPRRLAERQWRAEQAGVDPLWISTRSPEFQAILEFQRDMQSAERPHVWS